MKLNPYSDRLKKVRKEMDRAGLSAMVVSHLPNVRFLTGFTGSSALLLLNDQSARLFTDGRYTLQAREEAKVAEVEIVSGALAKAAGSRLRALGRMKVGIEAAHATVAARASLAEACGKATRLVDSLNIVERVREVKDHLEVRAIQRAARLICRVFDRIVQEIRPGVRETDLAAEAEYQMRKLGASGPSFETIVASGPRSALPHARPTSRRLRRSELVLIDMGAILDGYCSDLTRTVYLGKAPRGVLEWHKAVWEAHGAARNALGAGVPGGQVDEAARSALRRKGLDRYFTHSTGHGIGLEIHEGPRLARGQSDRLRAGQVVTVEPGIYIEGTGGIRIEDDVLVTPTGHKVLTRMSGELLQL